jgi:predicted ester cyclase
MSIEENKAVVQRFIDAFARYDAAAFREVAAPDLAKLVIEQWMPTDKARWPGRRLEITEMVAEDDRIWVRMRGEGRRSGEYMGIAPTDKAWSITGAGFMTVLEGKVVQFAGLWDELTRLKQLGAAITPPAREA